MDLVYMRFSTGDRTFFIAVVSAMSDLTLINGQCHISFCLNEKIQTMPTNFCFV